ncbi:MAG: ABC transporter permease [Bacteroidales bacterium]|nr:ABC transporter permease [Bacteroidales bacterium]
MNLELFIAKRIISDRHQENRISRPIVMIAVIGIALGIAAMIISTATVTGFKNQIRDKVIGFGSHIQIFNFDSNTSFETTPVNKNQDFMSDLASLPGIKHIQVFGTKAGIIKTDKDIQGIVLKGIGSDFDWDFFKKSLVEGDLFVVSDSIKTNKVLISKYISDLLELKVDDSFTMYFVQDPPRIRKFTVTGVYETSLEDFDKIFILADIGHIQKLNNWDDNQVSGFEITIDNFNDIQLKSWEVQDLVGLEITEGGTRLRVQSIIDKYPQIFDWLNLQDLNVWIILTLIFLVAGFNMVSSLLILILERTNMIGILKALGTRNWSIRKIFLYQSAYLIMKGLFWGNLIGIGFCLIQNQFGIIKLDQASYYLSEVPINLNLFIVLGLNISTLFLTIIMLLVPSYLISRISPVKAIRFN